MPRLPTPAVHEGRGWAMTTSWGWSKNVWPFSDRKVRGGRSQGCVSPWKVDVDRQLGWHIVLGMIRALSAGREALSPTH